MAEPHIIRLRGPWELEPLARFVAGVGDEFREETHYLPPGGKVSVPGDWGELLGPDFIGRVRYTRRFNCPTNLASDERVWLALDGVDSRADVALNGRPIGQVEWLSGHDPVRHHRRSRASTTCWRSRCACRAHRWMTTGVVPAARACPAD